MRGEANGELTDPLTIAGTFPPNGESHFFVGPFDVFDRTELKVRNVSIETCP